MRGNSGDSDPLAQTSFLCQNASELADTKRKQSLLALETEYIQTAELGLGQMRGETSTESSASFSALYVHFLVNFQTQPSRLRAVN